MSYNLRQKDLKDGSVNITLLLEENVKKLIESTVQRAVSDLHEIIKSLENKVSDLITANNLLTEIITKKSDVQCQTCILRENNIHSEDLNSTSHTDTSEETVTDVRSKNITSKQLHINKKEGVAKEKDKQKSHKTNKNNRESKVIIGASSISDIDNKNFFEAPERRLWIYIGRCKSNTTEEQISNYLINKAPGHSFDVSKLNSKGVNASFRVSADVELEEVIYDPHFWPTGIVVKRFKFFRKPVHSYGEF